MGVNWKMMWNGKNIVKCRIIIKYLFDDRNDLVKEILVMNKIEEIFVGINFRVSERGWDK